MVDVDQSASDYLLSLFDDEFEAKLEEDRLNKAAAERIRASFVSNWGSW